MYRHVFKNIVVAICLLSVSRVSAQEEFFKRLVVKTALVEREGWKLSGALDWQHIYDEIGWRRIGVDVFVERELKSFWNVGLGLANYYRFDREIDNLYELRPYVLTEFEAELSEIWSLSQEYRLEWRNFYHSEGGGDLHYLRHRLKSQIKYHIETSFLNLQTIAFAAEWYLLRNFIDRERFPNSRELTLKFTSKIGSNQLAYGYRLEKFLINDNTETRRGHTFLVEFKF